MRKVMAALLCAVMCLTAFTGCSQAELGYLSMCKGMMDTMESCTVSGQTQLDVDFDGLRGFAGAIEKEIGDNGLVEGLEGLSGKHTILLDYTMKMDMNHMAYSMDVDMSYQGKKYEMGELYFGLKEGVSISSEAVMGIYRLAKDVAADTDGGFFFTEEYEKALSDAAGSQYISLVTADEMGISPADLEQVMPKDDLSGLYDAAFRFYEDLFQGFESGDALVKEISGGYQIAVDGQTVARLLTNVLDFFAENPEQILNAAETYLVEVAKQAGEAEVEQEMQALFAELKGNTAEMAEALREASAACKEMMQKGIVQLLLDAFHYNMSVTQNGGRYNSEDAFTVTYGGKTVFSVTSKATCEKASASISFPKAGTTIEELGNKLVALTDEFNPAAGVAVTWGYEKSATKAMLEVRRQQEAPIEFTGGSTEADLVIRDGRAYVPLRAICDALGETVTWDKTARKATIAKDGKSIAMDGILEGGKSFVGVREFEKLGYTVSYQSVDGLKEAVIMK